MRSAGWGAVEQVTPGPLKSNPQRPVEGQRLFRSSKDNEPQSLKAGTVR